MEDVASSDPLPAGSQMPVNDAITALKDAIWKKRPILGEIMSSHGNQTLYDYSQDFMDVNPSPGLDARKEELIEVAGELIGGRLGADIAKGVCRQLRKLPLVSTADHHGPITHPFWVNANIISSLPYYTNNDPDIRYLVVLSFASISVNNASAYPRGILFHGGMNGAGSMIRLPLLPDKLKMNVVYGTRPFTNDEVLRAKADLAKKQKEGLIEPAVQEKVANLLTTYFQKPSVLGKTYLSSQITQINYDIWPQLFHSAQSAPADSEALSVPDLIYLDIETLVRELFLRYHVNKPDSLLHRLIFDPAYRQLAQKYFNNLPGAFSAEDDWGTYFFWGVDEKWHRDRLRIDGNTLRTPEGQYQVELTPEAISEALRKKRIFPSMLMCYLVVSLYYGMKCLGGFCQVHDLSVIKQALKKLLHAVGEDYEMSAISPVQTKELGGDGMVLSYLKTPVGDIAPATGIDMILHAGDTRIENYLQLSKRVTLTEIMNPMLPEMYTVLYPFDKRDPLLTPITPEEILKDTPLSRTLVDMDALDKAPKIKVSRIHTKSHKPKTKTAVGFAGS